MPVYSFVSSSTKPTLPLNIWLRRRYIWLFIWCFYILYSPTFWYLPLSFLKWYEQFDIDFSSDSLVYDIFNIDDILFDCMYTYVCVCMQMWMQVPSESRRDCWILWTRTIGDCEQPSVSTGNWFSTGGTLCFLNCQVPSIQPQCMLHKSIFGGSPNELRHTHLFWQIQLI